MAALPDVFPVGQKTGAAVPEDFLAVVGDGFLACGAVKSARYQIAGVKAGKTEPIAVKEGRLGVDVQGLGVGIFTHSKRYPRSF